MTHQTEELLDAALKLPEDERAELGAILVDSVGDQSSVAEIDQAWIEVAKIRLKAVQKGQSKLIPSEDVERELESMIRSSVDSIHHG